MTDRLLTAREVRDMLGFQCTETVLRWVRDGKLPAFRLPGGAIRFRQDDLDRWLAERATSRDGQTPQIRAENPAYLRGKGVTNLAPLTARSSGPEGVT
jgi:excisionase family DNA binding protein